MNATNKHGYALVTLLRNEAKDIRRDDIADLMLNAATEIERLIEEIKSLAYDARNKIPVSVGRLDNILNIAPNRDSNWIDTLPVA